MSWGIPDAPYIREAERRGTDYMYEWVYGSSDDYDEDLEEEEEEEYEDD